MTGRPPASPPVSARSPVAESPDTTKEEHGKIDPLLLKAKTQDQAAVRGEARLRQDMEDDRRFRLGRGAADRHRPGRAGRRPSAGGAVGAGDRRGRGAAEGDL